VEVPTAESIDARWAATLRRRMKRKPTESKIALVRFNAASRAGKSSSGIKGNYRMEGLESRRVKMETGVSAEVDTGLSACYISYARAQNRKSTDVKEES